MNKPHFIKNTGVAFVALLLAGAALQAKQVIELEPTAEDMTPVIRAALEGVTDSEVKLVFAAGTYHFQPEYAYQKYCAVTNHDNGMKSIIFPFEGLDSVEIEGNGAELIFNGPVMPFQFQNCGAVQVTDLIIDWDIPFLFQGRIVAVNEAEGWRDIQPLTDGYSFEVKAGRIQFPNIAGFTYSVLGSSLAFNEAEKRVAHGAWDFSSKPQRVEQRKGGILRLHEKLRHYPAVGTMVESKGPSGENRYAPAFHFISSSNIELEDIVVHHALGMGYLAERCDTLSLKRCGVYVRAGSDRVVSSTADATHFANCKGHILVEDCRFQHMLDDGTNVHGTYVEVDSVVDANTVRVKLGHFQQSGFEFAGQGDECWFIHAPDPSRASTNTVTGVKVLNQLYTELTFEEPLPKGLKSGDIVENKTWNPTFTLRGCTITDHRARSLILKSPLKTVIENNTLSSHMSAIQLRGETFYWYESGGMEDLVIRNNTIKYCAYSGNEHAVLYVTPRLSKRFDPAIPYDRNIRFENNTIETFDTRIVWADRVDGLVIKNNTIKQLKGPEPLYPDAPMFDFINCRDVLVSGNTYVGEAPKHVFADEGTPNLKVKNNKGF